MEKPLADTKLIDAFIQADWADVDVVAPDGTRQAHIRIDLAELPHALEVMRQLGTEVQAAVADYEHRCAPIHIEVDYF